MLSKAERLAETLHLAAVQAEALHAERELSSTAAVRQYIDYAAQLLTSIRSLSKD